MRIYMDQNLENEGGKREDTQKYPAKYTSFGKTYWIGNSE
jgi:hypothetical protein